MAMDLPRTVADDVADALAALDAAQREITHWRAHLHHIRADAGPGAALAARRCARIVAAVVADAVAHTVAAQRAGLSSVS